MYKNGGFQAFLALPLFDIIILIAGLLLVLTPTAAITLILRIIGLSLFIYAAIRGFVMLRFYTRSYAFMIILFSFVFLFFIGAVLLINPDGALRFLASAAGAYMVCGGALRLYRAAKIDSTKHKVLQYILAVLILAIGFALLIHPSGAVRLSGILIGSSFIITSTTSLLSRRKAIRDSSESEKNSDFISTDFVDKSDEL